MLGAIVLLALFLWIDPDASRLLGDWAGEAQQRFQGQELTGAVMLAASLAAVLLTSLRARGPAPRTYLVWRRCYLPAFAPAPRLSLLTRCKLGLSHWGEVFFLGFKRLVS